MFALKYKTVSAAFTVCLMSKEYFINLLIDRYEHILNHEINA